MTTLLSSKHVFISYSRRDEKITRALSGYLKSKNIPIWVDTDRLEPGTNLWEKEIEQAIVNAEIVIVILSPDAKESKWVRSEIHYAESYQKKIVPVLIRGDITSSIPLGLMITQFIDLRKENIPQLNKLTEFLINSLKSLQPINIEPAGNTENKNALNKPLMTLLPTQDNGVVLIGTGSNGEEIILTQGLALPFELETLSLQNAEWISKLAVWPLESFNLLYVQRQVLFCENGKKVVLFGSGENIYFYQSSNGKKINSLKVKDRGMLWGLADLPVKDISISPDAKYLASTIGLKETIQIWELKNNSLWKTLSGHESGINSIEYSSDGAFLASASDDGTIKLWDSETGQLIRTLDNHRNGIKDIVFSSDGELLIAGSSKGQITVWETKSGKLVKQLNGHTDEITMVCSTVDDEMIATSSKDNTVRIWNIPTGACTKAFGHDDNVLGIAFSRDGTILVSLTKNEKLYFWFAGTGKLITSFATEARTVITSPDGKMVIGVGMKSLIIYGVKRKEK